MDQLSLSLPGQATSERDLLASLLAYTNSRASAADLLTHFPSIGHMLRAEPAQLADYGVTRRDLALFQLVHDTACCMALGAVRDQPVLTNWQQLIDYCQTAAGYEQVEQFRILFLDRKNKLIADEVQQRGTIDHTPVYPREVVKRALILNAAAVILVHNHPSGDPKPSRDDIEMTREVKAAAAALGIAVHDHLVIGHGKHASFRSLGLLG